MRTLILLSICFVFASFVPGASSQERTAGKLHSNLRSFVQERESEINDISLERKAQLEKLATYIQRRRDAGQPVRLVFVCTHNSRRSHMSQLWATVAALYFNVDGVESFSGGTECTAFNTRAIAALKRTGFQIEGMTLESNPKYRVSFADGVPPLICFSKLYDAEPNPSKDFCAVMTCAQADKSCPTVRGASQRLVIQFEDPKVADDTPQEAAKYDERCAQICREMLFVFSMVVQRLTPNLESTDDVR